MPTNRTKRKLARRGRPGALARNEELYLWSGFNMLDGAKAFTRSDGTIDDVAVKRAWKTHGRVVLADFVDQFPCTRPWAWWKFEAPESRKRLFSPDFLVEINEPECVYLERRRLLGQNERFLAVRAGHEPVFEDEKAHWKRALDHAAGLEVTPKPVSQYVWKARKRNARDHAVGHGRGLWFDSDAANKVVACANLLMRHSKARWAGKPFRLSMWQEHDLIRPVFGWKKLPDTMTADEAAAIPFPWRKDADIFRRFHVVYSEVCRKNGKSTLLAIIGLILAFCDCEPGAEVYCAATKKDQARIVHGEMVKMRRSSPDIKAAVAWRKSELLLENADTDAIAKPLGADADTLDGLNSHGNIIDELHQHKTEEVYDKLTTGTGARDEYLTWCITTAGAGRMGVCWREREYAIKVVEGLEDDRYLGYIACADDESKWDADEEIQKANPNLGISVKITDLRDKARKARENPSDLNTHLRMYCGIWTHRIDYWVNLERWDQCNPGVNPVAWRKDAMTRLLGRPCAGGLDIGATSDLTVLTLAFPTDDKGFELLCWYWIAQENAEKRSRIDRAPYIQGIRDGFITATEGSETDYDRVEQDIIAINLLFKPIDIGGDPLFNGKHLYQRLAAFGVPVVEFPQNIVKFAAPMREMEEAIKGCKLYHGNDPVLRWMATNLVVYKDINNNMRPDKKRSTEKIDGMVTTPMAIDGCRRLAAHGPGSWAAAV